MSEWSTETEVQRILRLAFLYGALEEHDGKVFVPGVPRKPICGAQVLQSLIARGWLNPKATNSRFEITEEGKRAEGEINRPH
jgi:hypothetical protein